MSRKQSLTILHVAQPVEGGVPRVVVDLVRGQAKRGHRVVVACPEGGFLGAESRQAGARVVRWSAGRSPGPALWSEVRALRALVQQVRPGLVHLHSSKAGLAGRLAVRGAAPTVFQPHAWSFEAVGGWLGRASAAWEQYAARWTDRLVCVSEAEYRTGRNAGVDVPWSVVPNGVDLLRFDPVSLPSRAAARQRLGLPPDGPLAVCVGRLCRQKGQDVLLRAWPDVLARVPQARLALVGDGPDRELLHRQAAALDRVVLAGAVPDPRLWYAAADLVVLPSRWEGMALAPLEAMACARPVLLTDVAGARECLDETDVTIAVGDAMELGSALVRLLGDPDRCRDLGRRARSRIAQRNDLHRTRKCMEQVYLDVVRERRVPRPQAGAAAGSGGAGSTGSTGAAGSSGASASGRSARSGRVRAGRALP